MNCTEIRPLLSAYIDGEAAPEERGKVERHLAGCEDCRQAMAEYRAIGGSVRAMPMPVPPANLRRDVWRAIEAREAGGRWRPTSPRTTAATLPGRRTAPTVASVFTNLGNGWAKALPAALLVGALVLAFAVVMLRGPVATAAAQLVEQGEIFDYNQAVHVKFNKDVNYDEARQYTSVRRIEGTTPYTVTVLSEVRRTGTTTGELSLKPVPSWQAGATYEIFIDCPRISLVVGGAAMQKEPIRLSFTAAAHTPTPTSTPTETATPTNTPVPPTNTPEPTAVADNTKPSPSVPVAHVTAPASSTKTRPNATATKSSAATSPTGTRVPSTSTPAPVPTNTVEPARTALPTNTPMPPATQTGKPVHTPSPQPP
ncbi:MAG TPA: zf-HC2 domain-containing protein, partial [Chloroflexia bacterium]|nr:zf-HC2 domain-containing protein [Chloroflexia bacterium]